MRFLVRAVVVPFLVLGAMQAHAQLFGGKKEPQPIVLQAQGDRAAEINQLLEPGSDLDKLSKYLSAGRNRVALGQVRVLFATEAGGGNSKGGGMFGGPQTNVDVQAKLTQLQPELVQTLVDGFTAELTRAMTQRGYTVLPQEKLLENPDYAAAVAQTKSPMASGGAALLDRDSQGGLMSGDTGVVAYAKQTATPIGTFNRFKGYTDLSKSLENAVVLDLVFTVDFADFKKTQESGFFSGSKIGVELLPALSIRAGFLRMLSGDGNLEMVNFTFKQKVKLGGEIASKVTDVGQTAGQTAVSALNTLAQVNEILKGGPKGVSNGVGNFKGAAYEVTLVDNYGEVARKGLSQFADLISNALPMAKPAQ